MNRQKQRRDEVLQRKIILRIKELRTIHGHSQEKLNAGTGVNVASIENGGNYPNLTTLSIICDFYNISLGEFFTPLDHPVKK